MLPPEIYHSEAYYPPQHFNCGPITPQDLLNAVNAFIEIISKPKQTAEIISLCEYRKQRNGTR